MKRERKRKREGERGRERILNLGGVRTNVGWSN